MDAAFAKPISLERDVKTTAAHIGAYSMFPSTARAPGPAPILKARIDAGKYESVEAIANSAVAYVEHIVHGIQSNTRLKTPGAVTLPAANSPNALDLVIGRVRQFSGLEENWDGYGGVRIGQDSRNDAELFSAYHAAEIEKCLPKISCAGDGEINFSWKTAFGVIDLGLYGDGKYSYYAKSTDGRVYISDEEDLATPLPDEVIRIIS
ncbi:hypothetical protein [Pseudomonas sp. GCEP-101]|uniref:hypothetical protein n=1 Tax=Pseudomonas sp. GCEP-101 TaxID=2974552 RepID=UPI00223B2A63|nr:hypothetical protein [Pseudomonas sp. GCEP-101]